MANKGLYVTGLTKRFGAIVAVNRVTFHAAEGEFITLLGPSGCGKTTILRMIAGFIQSDEGDILFDGIRSNGVPPNRRPTAMVFQTYALFPHMSVYENIRFGLRMRNVPEQEQRQRVAEVLDMVHLEGLENRKPYHLSGGQQQRVALARAVVTKPRILLFDEPLSNLDAKLRENVRIEIRELQKRLGITALYVTHDQGEALALSDRIIVMNNGNIEQTDVPDRIYKYPANVFTAKFIGVANVLKGTCIYGKGRTTMIRTAAGVLRTETEGLEAGEPVHICWRPEDVTLSGSEVCEGENRIEGTVRETIYMGNLYDLFISLEGFILRAHVFGDCPFRTGDRVACMIPARKIHVMREG